MKTEKTYTIFRIIGEAPTSFYINVGRDGNLTAYDPEKKIRRAIRHCPNEESIFIKEQSETAKVASIVIEFGILKVDNTETSTLKFLKAHPTNGVKFEEVNPVKEAKQEIELDELITDLKYEVKQKTLEKNGVEELRTLISVLKDSISSVLDLSVEELKKEAYNFIDSNPYQFVNSNGAIALFNSDVKKRYIVLNSMFNEIIELSDDKKTFVWSDNRNIITSVPNGVMPINHFCEFLETNDGISILERLVKKLSSIDEDDDSPADESIEIKRRGRQPKLENIG